MKIVDSKFDYKRNNEIIKLLKNRKNGLEKSLEMKDKEIEEINQKRKFVQDKAEKKLKTGNLEVKKLLGNINALVDECSKIKTRIEKKQLEQMWAFEE